MRAFLPTVIAMLATMATGCATASAPPTIPRPPTPPQAQQQQEQRQEQRESAATSEASGSDRKQAERASAASSDVSSEEAEEGAQRPQSAAPDPDLVERTRADQAALEQARGDYRKRRANGSLDSNEAADYATYVAGLQRRVVEDCVELESSGAELPPDLPCATTLAGLPSAPLAIDPQAVDTGAERTAELDAELQASLGEFDEILIQEQDTVDGNAAGAFGDGSDGSAGGSGDGGQGLGREGREGQGQQGQDGQASAGREGAQGRSSEQSQSGKGGQGGLGSPGGQGAPSARGDIPEGSGDDVVARQLREAAEMETDPELKAKLWEEYRKYKQGTS